MALTVLQVAYPFAPVTPDAVGGAEQVLSMIDRGLRARGHRSLVVACQGSKVAGRLIAGPAVPERVDGAARERVWQEYRQRIAASLLEWRVDVAHFHGLDFFEYLPAAAVPTLVTLHLPIAWYPPDAVRPEPPVHVQCVSAFQRGTCPPDVPVRAVIENGVDLDALRPCPDVKGDYFLALGRICPEKGYEIALDAAKAAGIALIIAGETFPYPEHQRYLEAQIRPRLDARRRLIGPVGGPTKRGLLARARALVVPSQVAETSSLVAREALASGTPVIAFRRGALCDVVEPGRTGVLVDDASELPRAFQDAARLDPMACRRAALSRFDARVMLDRYVALYHALVREAVSGVERRAS